MEKRNDFDSFFSLTTDQKILFLQKLMIEETQKEPDEIDFDFIDRCSLLVLELQGNTPYSSTKEEQKAEIKAIIDRCNCQQQATSQQEAENIANPLLSEESATDNKGDDNGKRKGISIKKLFIIAAAAILLSTLATIVAVADDPFTFINKLFLDTHIDDISNGETISKGNITVTRSDKTTVYNSIEDMVEKEKLSGIWFPADLQISKLAISEYNEAINLRITPSNQTAIFSLNISSNDEYGLQYNVPTYTKKTLENGIDVWEYDKGEGKENIGRYQLMFRITGWYYCIATSYPEQGYELINNFTEVAP